MINLNQIAIYFALTLIFACGNVEHSSIDEWKQEILQTEANFAAMVRQEGMARAFLTYAAADAVLMRNNRLVKGYDQIADYFEEQISSDRDVMLTWKPDFVDVAASGDLGYTYGNYTITIIDTSGSETVSTGVFHTVWKRQADRSWKFVWD